mmetsp:Transcript_28165/g.39761  ORF Transcript_28165/g.39761 Transcript_28165/m.39761 type:complete len:298 (-) Transcript_28165:16-909(-)
MLYSLLGFSVDVGRLIQLDSGKFLVDSREHEGNVLILSGVALGLSWVEEVFQELVEEHVVWVNFVSDLDEASEAVTHLLADVLFNVKPDLRVVESLPVLAQVRDGVPLLLSEPWQEAFSHVVIKPRSIVVRDNFNVAVVASLWSVGRGQQGITVGNETAFEADVERVLASLLPFASDVDDGSESLDNIGVVIADFNADFSIQHGCILFKVVLEVHGVTQVLNGVLAVQTQQEGIRDLRHPFWHLVLKEGKDVRGRHSQQTKLLVKGWLVLRDLVWSVLECLDPQKVLGVEREPEDST